MVLSPEQKKKADIAESGVGIEYRIISIELRKKSIQKIYLCFI